MGYAAKHVDCVNMADASVDDEQLFALRHTFVRLRAGELAVPSPATQVEPLALRAEAGPNSPRSARLSTRFRGLKV